MTEPNAYNLPHGVELNELQVWRDPDDGSVVIQAPEGVHQVVFTPTQWEKLKRFVDGPECTCERTGAAPFCPVHDTEEST